ncbi:MAG: MerR family transcriptional regulator [Myxococcota bacterium]
MADNHMPIGRFARSCRLSVKALRHYDELGLLAPALVDPASGYRYYTRAQARDAVMIGMLRSLDLPLAVIRRALDAEPGELKALIEQETARIEAEVAARQQALLSLRHIAEHGRLAADVDVHELPDLHVARLVGDTTPERLVADSTELIYELLDELRRSGVAFGEVLSLNAYHDGDTRVTVQACAAVPDPVRGLERAEAAHLSGGSFACLEHVGPYETLGLAHHALFAWMQEHGHPVDGPIWEFYRNDPADVAAEALETRVALPLEVDG